MVKSDLSVTTVAGQPAVFVRLDTVIEDLTQQLVALAGQPADVAPAHYLMGIEDVLRGLESLRASALQNAQTPSPGNYL